MRNQSKPTYFVMFILLLASVVMADFKVIEIKGKPRFRANGSFKITYVKMGSKLKEGSRIKMADGDYLKVSTPMGDEIDFKDKAYFKLAALSDKPNQTKVELNLYQGISNNKVNPLKKDSAYLIRTPTSVVGVRGTEFDMDVQETGETEVSVIEGVVEVIDPLGGIESVELGAGKKAKVAMSGSVEVQSENGSVETTTTTDAQDADTGTSKTINEVQDTVDNEIQRLFDIEASSSSAFDEVQLNTDLESHER